MNDSFFRAIWRMCGIFLAQGALFSLAAALPSVQIGENFTAATFLIDAFAQPADSNGAVGPDHFVQFINGRFSVFEKAGHRKVKNITDKLFWENAGVSIPSNLDVTDPRLFFDPAVQRWYALQIDVDQSVVLSNRFLFAISATADPTGSWNGFAFKVDAARGRFGDFPTMGFDAGAIYVAADLFDSFSARVGSALVSIPKGPLLSDTPNVDGRTSLGTLTYRNRGEILQPAATLGAASGGGAVLAVGSIGDDFREHNTLIGSTVVPGANGAAPTLAAARTVTVPPYSVPINPAQPGGLDTLDDGDARLSSTVWRLNDTLYAVHAIQLNGRACLQWFELYATNFAVIQTGYITNADLELFFPSIAANFNGTVVIGCNGTSTNQFVSSFAFVGDHSGGSLKFGEPVLLKAGTATYANAGGPNGTSRWGDYSSTSLDPADPNRFWTIQMVPSGASVWTTQITEVIVRPPGAATVALQASLINGEIVISWPAAAGSYQLQTATALGSGLVWAPILSQPGLRNDQWTVFWPVSDARRFFRLASNP